MCGLPARATDTRRHLLTPQEVLTFQNTLLSASLIMSIPSFWNLKTLGASGRKVKMKLQEPLPNPSSGT